MSDLAEGGGPLGAAATSARIPDNLRLTYDGVSGAPVVAVMGPSQYGYANARDRYLQGIAITLGVDFRLLSCETYPVEVEVPPRDGDQPIEVDDFADETGFPCYRATWATTPPTTIVDGAFSGVWRAGLILDCGKDLPTLAEECVRPLPARAFVADLEAAFGTRLIEQGWIR